MTGEVDRFAEISPSRLVLAGKVGDVLKQTVTIRPTEKYPFEITGVTVKGGEHLKFDLDQRDVGCCREYLLTIENTMKTHGRYVDQIHLQTDSVLNPQIRLGITVFIRPAES